MRRIFATGVRDSIVAQLLSVMDGVDPIDNVLLIGLTNRRALIDPALLRPGRFEVVHHRCCREAEGRNSDEDGEGEGEGEGERVRVTS